MWFEEFQDDRNPIGYQDGTILAVLISLTPQCLSSSLSLIQLMVREQT